VDVQIQPAPEALDHRHEVTLAHEAAHWVLGHEGGLPEGEKRYGREIEATVRAVEILARVTGIDEREALRRTHAMTMLVEPPSVGRPIPPGHKALCVEIADVLRAFPKHASWTTDLECSPWGKAEK